MIIANQGHPLDAVLRARLHFPENATGKLRLTRAALHTVDAVSRAFLGKPFFALREAEAMLDEAGGKTGPALVDELLLLNGGTRITAHGLGHIPAQGAVVIAATHPTGIFDFLAHSSALRLRRPDLKVVANQDTESFLGSKNTIAIRITKENQATSLRVPHAAMQQHLDAGGALLIFGSGRVPYRNAGQLVEPKWRNGTSHISQQCDAPIVPAALDARNSPYYYRIRALTRYASGRNDNLGARIGSLRYAAELLEKLGGEYSVFYGTAQPPGTAPDILKAQAEGLVPGLYLPE